MRQILQIVIGIVILGLAILGAYFIVESNTKEKPVVEKVVKTVFIDTVRNATIPITIPANGNLTAKNRLELYSEVQGVFTSSAHDFKPGQRYNRGETLIRMDASEYYASVQSSKSNLYNLITAIMPDLRLDYPEAFPKWQAYLDNYKMENSVAELPESSDEKVNYFISGRGILTAYYNVKNLEQRLSKYSMRAPFSGIVTEALVTKGTLIRSGQKLGEFIDTSVFELELSIAKKFSDLLKIGENVELQTLEGNQSYKGKVTRVNGRIDQTTQTIKVFVEVNGDDLKEGMYLEAKLEAREEPDAVRISRKLLVDQKDIFIVRDSVLDLIEVNPVYFGSEDVIITGVPDGTVMLSRPLTGAYAGMLVKVNQENTSTNTTKTENAE